MKTALSLNFKQIATFTWFRTNISCSKNKLVKGRGFDTYKTTEKKKEHKGDAVFTETGNDDVEFIEEDEGVPHITHANNILHSIYSNAELYIIYHQIYNSNAL